MSAAFQIADPWQCPLSKVIRRVGRYVLLGTAITVLGFTITGCEYFPESTFKLATESRLPKWVTLPQGLKRSDVSITMNYYVKPWGSTAKFVLQDTKGQTLEKADGEVKCREPFHLNPRQGSALEEPAYEGIIVNGTTEMIEHKKMEPIFYVTDDPIVWRQYRANGCG